MTREEKLQHLRAALHASQDGVFVVVSTETPILGEPGLSLAEVLEAEDIAARLQDLAEAGPIEIVAEPGIPDGKLRLLNHRRDQLRVGRPLLFVFDPADSTRVSRIADDFWKWATVIELDEIPKAWAFTAARGIVSRDRYAPALRPGDVLGPQGPLTAIPEILDREPNL